MKSILNLSFFCLLFLSANIAAQDGSQDHDPKAKHILDEVSAQAKSYLTMRAEFSYSTLNNKEGINEKQEGSITIKGDKYRLALAGQEVFCDGKVVWTWLKDAGEVQISEKTEDKGSITPTNIFTIYEKDFKYKYSGEEQKNGKLCHIIKLFPIKANERPYHTIILTIDKTNKHVESLTVKGKEGNDYTYTVKKFETNIPAEDAAFTFDKNSHPGVEVIDLR